MATIAKPLGSIERGDTVTPVDNASGIRAWAGTRGIVDRAASGYDWIIDFNGSPVPCNNKELRKCA